MSWIKLCALAFWLYHVMINVFSTSSNVQLFKRQARDERGKSIDLNREATPEPDLPTSQSASHVSPSTPTSKPRSYTLSDKKEPRFRLPRTYKKIEVPPNLTPEEVKAHRHKVKVARRREAWKKEKESNDPAVRKIVEENYKMILERQRVYDTNMRKRVKDGTATEKEKNMTERKKQKNLNYYYRVRNQKGKQQSGQNILNLLLLLNILQKVDITVCPPATESKSNITLFRRQVRDFDLNKEPSPEPEVEASTSHSERLRQSQMQSAEQVPSQATQASKRYKTPKTWRKIEIPDHLKGEERKAFHNQARIERRREERKRKKEAEYQNLLSTSTNPQHLLEEMKRKERYQMPRSWNKITVPSGLSPEEIKTYRDKVKFQRKRQKLELMKQSDDPAIREKANEPYKKELEKQKQMRKRVREGVATEKEKEKVARKNLHHRQYYRSLGKKKEKERRQKLVHDAQKGTSNSGKE